MPTLPTDAADATADAIADATAIDAATATAVTFTSAFAPAATTTSVIATFAASGVRWRVCCNQRSLRRGVGE